MKAGKSKAFLREVGFVEKIAAAFALEPQRFQTLQLHCVAAFTDILGDLVLAAKCFDFSAMLTPDDKKTLVTFLLPP